MKNIMMNIKTYDKKRENMSEKTIYIAGKVTGTPIAECTMKFGTAQKLWEKKGYDVINPLELVNDWHCPWDKAMRICIHGLCVSQEAYFLKDWQNSKGARLEHEIATALQIPIYYEKD